MPTSEDVSPLFLRPATNADAEAVRALVFSILADYGLRPDPASTDKDLEDIEGSYFGRGGRFDVLTTRQGEVVGSVGLYPTDPGVCELRKMYLRADQRGKGWGKKLLEFSLEQARTLGFGRMTLETAKVLVEAIRLYEAYGFRPYLAEHMSARCDATYFLDL
jgi:putative acetyltransferase